MTDDDRYVLIATTTRYWLDASIQAEHQLDHEHVAVWGKPDGDVIAAGSFDACRAAGRLLLEET